MFLKKIILFILGLLVVTNLNAQLEISNTNTNYLSYNGKDLILLGATASNNDFHVLDFQVEFLDSMKIYGANHTWFMLENFYNVQWSYTKNTPKSFYDKIETICKRAYELDIIVGISFYGYGLINYPTVYSFNSSCSCKGDPGPLINPMDFYDVNSKDPLVVEAREVQLKIINETLKKTWKYPNVYYSPGWEIKCIWNNNVKTWFTYIDKYIKSEGAKIDPNIKHLIAIERTTSASEFTQIKADFTIDEDGNAKKTSGIPFVYWSTDGIYRNTSVWNNKLTEPKSNLQNMKQVLLDGAAGTASIWQVNLIEKQYLKTLNTYLSLQDSTILFDSSLNKEILKAIPDTVWHDEELNLLPQFNIKNDNIAPEKPYNVRIF